MSKSFQPGRRRPSSLSPLTLAALALLNAPPALRAAEADDAALRIGTVVVTGTAVRDAAAATAAQMREADSMTVAPALEQIAGVVQSRVGQRGEQMAYVRGFDLRQTPLFIDGVPVYVPYDGYVDLGRFNTFDLAKVQVDKGYSSMLYGANTLGGAINLVGRRPTQPLEIDAGAGVNLGHDLGTADASWGYANVGLRQAQWYAQAGFSHLAQQAFELPAGFAATKAEDGGDRNNSQLRDRKLSLKLGWTPRGDDEYTLNIIDQHGTKGSAPYAGNVSSVTPRYWRWPYWDKQSVYALTRTSFGAAVLKLRLFHDTFRNALFTYDDATYTTQKKSSSFQSWYDDYSNGASAQLDYALTSSNALGVAAHWKEDIHREHNAGEPVRHNKDRTTSLAIEDSQRLGQAWRLTAGLGHDERATLQAEDYNSTTKVVSEFAHGSGSATNAQLQVAWEPSAAWQWRASLAHKTRFPTIKDRYSYRLGTALPNADLKPERALHAELALDARPWPWLQVSAAVFRSNISDLIQSVTITTLCGSSACTQMQNIGRARAMGFELGGQAKLGAGWSLDGHYQYLDRDNLSKPAVLLTDTPRHQALAHLAWAATPELGLHVNLKKASARWSSSDGLQLATGFTVLDLKAQWQATKRVGFEAGMHNVTDRLYAYSEGFPEPGRQVFLQARLNWQ